MSNGRDDLFNSCVGSVGGLIFSDDTDDEPEVHCTKNYDDIRGICLRLTVLQTVLVGDLFFAFVGCCM